MEIDPSMVNGIALGIFLVSMMIAPIYCCQVSDEEYNKIVSHYKAKKHPTKDN